MIGFYKDFAANAAFGLRVDCVSTSRTCGIAAKAASTIFRGGMRILSKKNLLEPRKNCPEHQYFDSQKPYIRLNKFNYYEESYLSYPFRSFYYP